MLSLRLVPFFTTPVRAAPRAPRRHAYVLHVEGQSGASVRRCAADLPEAITLAPDAAQAVSLRALDDLQIACTAGTVWLTCERDPRDYVLDAGDRHVVRPGDALVLFGMPRGAVLMSRLKEMP